MPKRTNITEGKTAIKFVSSRKRGRKQKFIKFYNENGGGSKDTVSYACFYDRVKHGWDWDEAIKVRKNKYEMKIKKYIPKSKQGTEKTFIDVKYDPEEAKVFKSTYENIINSLEEEYAKEEEPEKAEEIAQRKKDVEKEYQIFLHHNQ